MIHGVLKQANAAARNNPPWHAGGVDTNERCREGGANYAHGQVGEGNGSDEGRRPGGPSNTPTL